VYRGHLKGLLSQCTRIIKISDDEGCILGSEESPSMFLKYWFIVLKIVFAFRKYLSSIIVL